MFPKQLYADKNDDTEDEIKIENLKKNTIIQVLKDFGILDYGKTIHVYILEKIFNTKYSQCSEKEWKFNLLFMKQLLESESFFVTTRALNGGIRTLSREEMPFYNEKENKKTFTALKNRQKSLYMINPNDMKKEYSKKLEFEQLRNGSLILDYQDLMKKRCK